jgi:membrane-associated phospholipid phosphatase
MSGAGSLSRPPAQLALSLGAFLVTFAVFGLLTPANRWDYSVEADAHKLVLQHPVLLAVARDVTVLGSAVVLWSVCGFAIVALCAVRRPVLAFKLAAVCAAGQLTIAAAKMSARRDRPAFADPVAHAAGYALPSGHAAGSTTFYGAIFVIAIGWLPVAARRPVGCAVAALIAAVAASRVLLGVHWASDVIAGVLLGSAFVQLTRLWIGPPSGGTRR